jgi:hypothetical protein
MSTNNSINNTLILPSVFRCSAVPEYVSSTQVSIAYLYEVSQASSCKIVSSSALTLSTNSTGANGFLVSPNLTGTVSVTNGSTTVTGSSTLFTDPNQGFVVGDTINTAAGSRRVVSITSNTSLTVNTSFSSSEAGMTFTRGGLSDNTIYYLYAIAQNSGVNPAIALSTRSIGYGQTFPLNSLPSGYTQYREMPFSVYINPSGAIQSFVVAEGWPHAPTIIYNIDQSVTTSTNTLFSGTVSTSSASPTTVGCFPLVPLTASYALINLLSGGTTGNLLISLSTLGSIATTIMDGADSSGGITTQCMVPVYSWGFYTYSTVASYSVSIWLVGYTINKVM